MWLLQDFWTIFSSKALWMEFYRFNLPWRIIWRKWWNSKRNTAAHGFSTRSWELWGFITQKFRKEKGNHFFYFLSPMTNYFQPEKTAQYKTLKSLRAKLGRLIGYIDDEVLPILKWDAFRKKNVHFAIAVSSKWYWNKTWIINFYY